jgi:hypothetical protein
LQPGCVLLVRAAAAALLDPWRDGVQKLLVLTLAAPLAAAALLSGDTVHLAIMYPACASKIALDRSTETAFDWGGTGFAVAGNSMRALVYDGVSPPRLTARAGTRSARR